MNRGNTAVSELVTVVSERTSCPSLLPQSIATAMKIPVLVTGASGKTGALVVAQLLKMPEVFAVRAVIRSAQARQLLADLGVSPDNIFSAGLSPDNPASLSALKVALQGCEALVICTSAVPQPHVLATLWGAAGHFIRQRLRRDSTDDPFVPVATWKGGQTPQQVDWQGAIIQIDAAKAAGLQHIVLVSSAGGCDPQHFLNYIGNGEGGRKGNILNWKRAAEQHLVASGVTYTILHPNHLIDDSRPHQLELGVDDSIQQPHWRHRLRMPRSLLAVLVVQLLLLRDEGAGNRSIDCAGRAVSDASQATNSMDQVRQLLTEMPLNADYTINDRTQPDALFV
jgi:uncharacterized protein YbjT (DUF2867 family)